MMNKFLQAEKKIWKKGYKNVIGLDEAGRGPLAGPVVAAAILVNSKFKIKNSKLQFKIKNLKDSKKLTPENREKFYQILINHPDIGWGIGRVSEKIIDKINILEATKLAMKKAINNLRSGKNKKPANIDFLIIDGNFKLDLEIPQESVVKADEKIFSCITAGIIAKVTRDRIMNNYAKKFPEYNFDKNKGYPTKKHLQALKKHKPSRIHRKTFKGVLISKTVNNSSC